MNPAGTDQSQEIGLPLDAAATAVTKFSSYLHNNINSSPIMTENVNRTDDDIDEEVDNDFIPPIAEIVISEPLTNPKDVEISNDSKGSKTSNSSHIKNGENSDDSPISSALSTASSALHIMRRESSADNFSLLASTGGTAKTSLTPQPIDTSSAKGSTLRRKGFPSRRDRASSHAQVMLEDEARNRSASYGSLSSYNRSMVVEESWRLSDRSAPVVDSNLIYGSHHHHYMLRPHSAQSQSQFVLGPNNGGAPSMAPARSSPRKVGRRGSMPLHVVGKQEGLVLRHSNSNSLSPTSSAAQFNNRQATQPQSYPRRQHLDYSSTNGGYAISSHPNTTGRPVSKGGHFETSPPSSYIFSHRAGGSRSTARMNPLQSPGRRSSQRQQQFYSTSPACTEATESNTDYHSASRESSQTPITENISVKSGLTASSVSSTDRRRAHDVPNHPPTNTAISLDAAGGESLGSVLVPRRNNRTSTLVSFGTVEIRRYQRILGDNPSCSSGPALSLDWDYDDDHTSSKSVDDYEYYRGQRLDDTEMVLTRYEREELLLDLGYSKKEIAEAIRKNVNIKNRRRQTVNNLKVMPFEQAIEGAARKISRVVLRKGSSKSLYKNWLQENPINSRTQAPIVCQEESSSSMESQSHESPIRTSLKSDASIASSSVGFRSRDSTKGAHTSTTMTTTTHSAEYSMTMTQAAVSITNDGEHEDIHSHHKPEYLRRKSSTHVTARISKPTLNGWTTNHVSTEEPRGGYEASFSKTRDHKSPNRSPGICNEIIIMEQEDTFVSQ